MQRRWELNFCEYIDLSIRPEITFVYSNATASQLAAVRVVAQQLAPRLERCVRAVVAIEREGLLEAPIALDLLNRY